jgi:hypothetical protein
MNENTPNQKPYSPELRAAYDEAIRSFTLDELRKYETPEEGFPLEDILAEMEAIQKCHDERQAGQ